MITHSSVIPIHILYRSSNIVSVIKYRKLRLKRLRARVEEGRSDLKILTGKPTGTFGEG